MSRVETFIERIRPADPRGDRDASAPIINAELVFEEAAPREPEPPAQLADTRLANLFELILKNQPRLNFLARHHGYPRELIPRLLAIALAGYAAFGVVLAMLFALAGLWPELRPLAEWVNDGFHGWPVQFHATQHGPVAPWLDGSAVNVVLAHAVGMCAAIGVCLPSFYFYGLLAGLRTTMLQVATQAVKASATSAVALLGILPIYLAGVLGMVVFKLPHSALEMMLEWGLVLPFVAGLLGVRSLYVGFLDLADTLPAEVRWERELFLKRLMLAWCGCFTAVTPVMIYTIWQWTSQV